MLTTNTFCSTKPTIDTTCVLNALQTTDSFFRLYSVTLNLLFLFFHVSCTDVSSERKKKREGEINFCIAGKKRNVVSLQGKVYNKDSWFYIWIKNSSELAQIHIVVMRFLKRYFLQILFSILLSFFFFANRFYCEQNTCFAGYCKSSVDLWFYEKPYVYFEFLFPTSSVYSYDCVKRVAILKKKKHLTCRSLICTPNNMKENYSI